MNTRYEALISAWTKGRTDDEKYRAECAGAVDELADAIARELGTTRQITGTDRVTVVAEGAPAGTSGVRANFALSRPTEGKFSASIRITLTDYDARQPEYVVMPVEVYGEEPGIVLDVGGVRGRVTNGAAGVSKLAATVISKLLEQVLMGQDRPSMARDATDQGLRYILQRMGDRVT